MQKSVDAKRVGYALRDGLGRSKLVRLVSLNIDYRDCVYVSSSIIYGLNKVQAVLSQICDYNPVSVTAVLELARFYLN